MAVTVRLMKFGKRAYPTYRIVALDKRKKRDGSYLEKIGTYNPHVEPMLIVDHAKLDAWVKKGAILSEGIRKLMSKINKTRTK